MKRYKSRKRERDILRTYGGALGVWGVAVEEMDVDTFCGSTHVIACGDKGNPPLLLFHGVSDDSALAWALSAPGLAKRFRVYAVDTVGGPGKSVPNENYVRGFDAIRWLDDVLAGLGAERAFFAGVSAGAYIAQLYAVMRPEKAEKVVCISRTALASATGKHAALRMMKVLLPEALFPTMGNIRKIVRKFAGGPADTLTGNPALMEHYRCLLKGYNSMAMACYTSVAFSADQLRSLRGRALFLCGGRDPLCDIAGMENSLRDHRLAYRVFPEAGHLVQLGTPGGVNREMVHFFLDSPVN